MTAFRNLNKMTFLAATAPKMQQLPQTGDASLQVFGRLRYGKDDLGVNRNRIKGWMAALDAETGAQ